MLAGKLDARICPMVLIQSEREGIKHWRGYQRRTASNDMKRERERNNKQGEFEVMRNATCVNQ